MEGNTRPLPPILSHPLLATDEQQSTRLVIIREELEYLNTTGKRFVAAIDRFQVHRALLSALQELYSFSACCILLKGEPYELFIIPCRPLHATFIETMIQRIASAAMALDFPPVTTQQLTHTAYFDAPDDIATARDQSFTADEVVGSCLSIPLIVENHIIGLLSLFDQREDTFNTNVLQLTAMIADYAAVALENVRLRERQNALWRDAELERTRLELIISSMAEGLLITDADGAIKSLNTSARQLLAQARVKFMIGLPLDTLTANEAIAWLPRLVEIIQEALTGKTVKNQELIASQYDERVPLTLSVSTAPLYDTSELEMRVIGVVAVINDITSNKQVERLKDDFVSVVSHELRTPLTAIKGYTQHLIRRIERRVRRNAGQEATLDAPEYDDLHSLSIVHSQTDHLERLVNELLDLSQVQWNQLRLHYETFSLAQLLIECVRSIQASAEQHQIILNVESTMTEVVADRNRIEQVFGNILDNAVKYSPHGGSGDWN
jgi:PAS domain S-box-containing protein